MSVILKSYNALNSHHFNGISSNVHRNPNVTMYSLELYCSLLVFSLRVQPKVHIQTVPQDQISEKTQHSEMT